jgi:hypothetical protein
LYLNGVAPLVLKPTFLPSISIVFSIQIIPF